MTKKSELKESIKERLKLYRGWSTDCRKLLQYLDHVPDLSVEGEYLAADSDHYQFDMGWDNALVKQARKEILTQGWKEHSDIQDTKWGSWTIEFKKIVRQDDGGGEEKLSFILRASLYKADATCVRTKIGEKMITKMQPIYEITCPEGADGMAMEVIDDETNLR